MKMWSVDVLILLLFCYACLSPGNAKVHFVSKNFHNILHWDPVESTSAGEKVLYSVQYQSYAENQFQIKPECQNISALTCDLTAETPSLPDVHYHAKVLANGRLLGLTSARFKPIAETTLGAANLSMHTTASSLFVNVTLPLGPDGVSVADIIRRSRNGPSRTGIEYTLHITEPAWAELVNESTTGRFVINLKNNGTKYCGHVVYRPSSDYGRAMSEKTSFCVTLPDNPHVFLPWLYAIAALLLAAVLMSVVWTCKYAKGGKKKNNTPESLKITSGTFSHPASSLLQPPDSHIVISTPVVGSLSDQPQVPADSVGGYSPQDMPFQPWQGSTGSSGGSETHSPTTDFLEVSSQSSEVYSSVVHVPAEENRDVQQATADTEPLLCGPGDLISRGVQALPDLDACESGTAAPLRLHTERDPNGQLVLPSLTCQLVSCTGDAARTPLLSALASSDEEGPSLASLQRLDSAEWPDSGCDDCTVTTPTQPYANSHYIASRTPGARLIAPCCDETFGSGYKQNWMPAILQDATSKDENRETDCDWNWTPSEEEEGEGGDGGDEEGSRQIVLGKWVVKIQE